MLKLFEKQRILERLKRKEKKEENPYPSGKICERVCSSKENYIDETKRIIATDWNEHENSNKDLEPAKHLSQHPDHVFQWKILMYAPTNIYKRKDLEAFFIAVKHPTLKEQCKKIFQINSFC